MNHSGQSGRASRSMTMLSWKRWPKEFRRPSGAVKRGDRLGFFGHVLRGRCRLDRDRARVIPDILADHILADSCLGWHRYRF